MILTNEKLYGLLYEYRDKLLERFPNQIERIILYGSYARGTPHDDSDIDVMIVTAENGKYLSNGLISWKSSYDDDITILKCDLENLNASFVQTITITKNAFALWSPLGESVHDDGIELWRNGQPPMQQYDLESEESMKQRKLTIEDLMNKAEENIRVAENLFSLKHYRHVYSVAYYAMFYSAKAVLMHMGINTKSHGGVENQFNFHLVHAGILDKRYHQMLTRNFETRMESDYGSVEFLDLANSDAAIEESKLFVAKMQELL